MQIHSLRDKYNNGITNIVVSNKNLCILIFCSQEFGLKFDEVGGTNKRPCNFDYNNEKNPCQHSSCLEDDTDTRCIRYTLDYCRHYDDRGCVVTLPQMMNKLASAEYNEIQQMHPEFQVN